MISEEMYRLGSRRSSIRELFEYGKAAAVRDGAENVFDFSLGNPSTPPPEIFTKTLAGIIENEEPCSVHGYTSLREPLRHGGRLPTTLKPGSVPLSLPTEYT